MVAFGLRLVKRASMSLEMTHDTLVSDVRSREEFIRTARAVSGSFRVDCGPQCVGVTCHRPNVRELGVSSDATTVHNDDAWQE
jgi:hypothetical protein